MDTRRRLTGAFSALFAQALESGPEGRQLNLHHSPDRLHIEAKIIVYDDIAETSDRPPGVFFASTDLASCDSR